MDDVAGIVNRLAPVYEGVFARETIERYVSESLEYLAATSRVTRFFGVLGERFARERLDALAQVEGLMSKERPEVLFVCVHNAGRSQMAAGLLDWRSAGQVHVRSAGSDPADTINPAVVEVMRELGLDLEREFPKPLTDEVVRAADVVITMGCGDACPIYTGKRYLDWDLQDPAGRSVDDVREIRNAIDLRIQALLHELDVPVSH